MIKTETFLPKVRATTIIWTDLNGCGWEAAQGDNLKLMQPTIELNLYKLSQRGEVEAVAQGMVEQWLGIYTVLATRQDLINKHIRGEVDNEDILYEANYKAIMGSKSLRQKYAYLAIEKILNGRWVVDTNHKELAEKIKALLTEWRNKSDEITSNRGKCYLCGKTLLPDGITYLEYVKFVVNTPTMKMQPTPFIDTLVWVCPECQPLSKQMEEEAKPFEVKAKGLENKE